MDENVELQEDVEPVELPSETEPDSEPVEKTPAKTKKSAPHADASDKTDWKAKYDGLQGYAKQQRTDAEKYKRLYSEAIASQEALVAEKDARIEELEKRVAELESANAELSTERDKLSKRQEISRKIRQDHPDLLELYEDGLLRVDDMEDEALEDYLSTLADRLAGKVGSALRDTLRGSAPPRPSGKKAAETSSEIADKLMQLDPKSDEYKMLYSAYEEALRAEDAKK